MNCEKWNPGKVWEPHYVTRNSPPALPAANARKPHVRIIQEKYIQRQLIRIATETVKNAYEDTTDADLLDKTERGVFELTNGLMNKQNRRIRSALLVQSKS